MGLYAVMRGIIEAFRDSQILFAGVRTTQVASLAVAIQIGRASCRERV